MKRLLFLSLLITSSLGAEVTLPDAIRETRPGAQWVLRNNTYAGLEWLDKVQTKPTKEELDAALLKLEQAEPFPTVQEQLDAILEGGPALTKIKERIERARNREPREDPGINARRGVP